MDRLSSELDLTNASPSFRAFVESVTQAPRTREEHEGYDMGALFGLRGAERRSAERLLIEALHRDRPDVRAVKALAALRTPSTMEALADALPGFVREGHVGAAVLTASRLLDEDRLSKADAVQAARLGLARGAIHQQNLAADLLVRMWGPDAWRAMLDLVADMPLPYVRAKLYQSCLDALGVEQKHREPPSNLATLGELIGAKSKAARDVGVAEFRSIAEKLSEGLEGAKAGVRRGKGKRKVLAARKSLGAGTMVDLEPLTQDGRDYLGAWILGQLPTDVNAYYLALDILKPALARPILEDLASWPADELGPYRPLIQTALDRLP